MFNFDLFTKKLKKQLIAINRLLENFFNSLEKIKRIKSIIQKKISVVDKKLFLSAGSIIIIILVYFLFPSFYNKENLKALLNNQINDQYNINIKFNEKVSYGLFPKPHFFTKDLSILYSGNEIAKINTTRIYISLNNFFKLNNLKVEDVIFDKSEFEIDSNKISFFEKVFNSNNTPYKVHIKNSNLFYKNIYDEIIFISKINDLKFLYDKINFENKLILDYEVFNLPFNLKISKKKIENKVISKLKSTKIKLKIDNEFKYDKKNIDGILDVSIMTKEKSFNYEIDDNSLNYFSNDNKYKGFIEFKPFYLFSEFKFAQISLKKLFNDNSLFVDFLNSEISNNQNLNMNLNIKIDRINEDPNLRKFNLNTYLEEGFFFIRDSKVLWRDELVVKLNEVQLDNRNENIRIIGAVNLSFNKINDFFGYFQIQREHRKNIKNINFDFVYDLNLKKLTLDNVKIDNYSNSNLNKFIDEFNSKEINFNKVTFRNFVKNFFAIYSG